MSSGAPVLGSLQKPPGRRAPLGRSGIRQRRQAAARTCPCPQHGGTSPPWHPEVSDRRIPKWLHRVCRSVEGGMCGSSAHVVGTAGEPALPPDRCEISARIGRGYGAPASDNAGQHCFDVLPVAPTFSDIAVGADGRWVAENQELCALEKRRTVAPPPEQVPEFHCSEKVTVLPYIHCYSAVGLAPCSRFFAPQTPSIIPGSVASVICALLQGG